MRKRALGDLYFFNSFVLGFANVFPLEAETHLLWHRFLERKTGVADLDSAPMQLFLAPRETGKSTTGTIGSAIQEGCRNPDVAILIGGVKAELAADFLKSIKGHFERNELLRALFPEVIPPDLNKTEWSATRATLKRTSMRPEPTFDTIGVGGSVTGKHYDRIIIDDPIDKDVAESIRTGTKSLLEEINFWVTTLRPLLSNSAQPFPQIRFNGTRWWAGDTYEHIEKTFGHGEPQRQYRLSAKIPETGQTVSRMAYRVGDLAVMRISAQEHGQPTFPKIHNSQKLASMREENPELYAAFMLNDPTDASVRTLQDSWLRYFKWVDNKMVCYPLDKGEMRYVFVDELWKQCVVDPAFTAHGRGARAAIVITGTDMSTGKHLVLEAIAERLDPSDLCIDILTTCKRHNVTRIFVEAVAQQAGFIALLERVARERGMAIALDTVKPGGRAKDVRIESLAPYFKNGLLYVRADQHDLLDEYRQFKPGAIYKDLLDALAYTPEHFPRVTAGSAVPSAAERAKMQLASYYKSRHMQNR